jgi:hypothetical protein
MILALALAAALGHPFDFYGERPYDIAVPKPESILGYRPGEWHSTFRDQERVVTAIAAAAKDRVRMFEYGKTAEGRPLRVFAVSSPENIRRLSEIRDEHALLAKGQGDPAKTIPIVWINECIHGDETASFEAGMWTLYNLAASRGELAKALKKEVVIFNPVYNPDGHERYVVYYNSIAIGSPDPNSYEHHAPEVMLGRLNHYRFDMNRDRIAFSQDETRAEFAEMLKWNPQVYIDQHGQVSSYFFPPEPMAINANVDRARNAKWTNIFGRATGRAFDQQGMSYFVRDDFDLFYPGYVDSSNTLTGAIGMTHETDGGRVLSELRPDGSTVTLRQGMAKHFTSALAVVKATAERGSELLSDYASFKRSAATGAAAGSFQRLVVMGDPRALRRLQLQLGYAGIDSQFATRDWDQPDSHDYWSDWVGIKRMRAGSLVVDMSQSQGAFAKALLEPKPQFETAFTKEQVSKRTAVPEDEVYPGRDEAEFYDLTAWSLPYAQDLQAWWSSQKPVLPIGSSEDASFHFEGKAAAYAIPYRDDEDALAAFDAVNAGLRGMVTTKPMHLETQTFPSGTFLFLAGRNEDGFAEKLKEIASRHGAQLVSLDSTFPDESSREGPGSESVLTLHQPKIAMVMGNPGALTECGAIWFLLERVWKLPFTAITNDALSNGDLSKYNCIILPSGSSIPPTGKFKDWIGAGNVAISLHGDDGHYADFTDVAGDIAPLPGSLFRATLDPRSFLSYGYEPDASGSIVLAAPMSGHTFHEIKKAGGSVATFPADPKKTLLLSGWEWPDDTENHLRGTVFIQDVPVDQGHMIIYSHDPTERAMWPGLYKTLLNAALMGSGVKP